MSPTPQTQAEDASSPHASHVIAVVGPTGVGKSAIAQGLALRLGGEVISADSMQVYRGMDVGTAKLAVAERLVPHHCIDIVDPGEPFSAALFQRVARRAIDGVLGAGGVPVVAGGTGLYVRAALDEMRFPAGDQSDNPVREQYEELARKEGPDAVYHELLTLDPRSAALVHPNNTRRVIRALELHAQGESYAEQSSGFSARVSHYPTHHLGLTMDRETLYSRIDARVDQMVADGLVQEVTRLLDEGFRDALTAPQAIGYKELVPVVEQTADPEQAICAIKQATRRYAKRQLTWFRADRRIAWLDVTGLSTERTVELAQEAIHSVGQG